MTIDCNGAFTIKCSKCDKANKIKCSVFNGNWHHVHTDYESTDANNKLYESVFEHLCKYCDNKITLTATIWADGNIKSSTNPSNFDIELDSATLISKDCDCSKV